MIKNYFLNDIHEAYFSLLQKRFQVINNFIIVRIIFILNNKYLPYAKYCAKCCFIEINKHVPFSQEVCNLKSDQEASDMLLLKPRQGSVCPGCSGALNLSVVILLHKHTNNLLDVRWFLQGHTRCVVEPESEVWCTWPQACYLAAPELTLIHTSSSFSLAFKTKTCKFMNSLPSPSLSFHPVSFFVLPYTRM